MRHRRLCILPLILVLILLTTSCDSVRIVIPDTEKLFSTEKPTNITPEESTDNPTVEHIDIDEADLIGALTLLPEGQKVKWDFQDEDARAELAAWFEDVALKQVMELMGLLAQNGWYMTENSAYKGARSLNIRYSMETRLLELGFSLDKTKAEWPTDVLPPYLDHMTPAFPFGQYMYYEEHQTSVGGADSTMIVYEGVDEEKVKAYTQMLLDAGYVHGDDPAIEFYVNGLCFVELAFHAKSGQVGLFVGQEEISPASLPPWPTDEIPDFLVRILPPMAAVLTASGGEDQILVMGEKVSLCDLYDFFTAAKEHYGWLALSGQNEMIHQETGFGILIYSYESEAQTWTLVIFDATQPNSTQEPDSTQTPDVTLPPATESADDEIGVTEFGYRVTKGRYSEQNAMLGVLDEFGQYADMADWSDIKALYGDNMTAFLDEVGVKVDNDVWVKYDGQRFDGSRHFFLARIGKPREDFLAYDKIDDIAWLGSWYGIEMPVLAKVPAEEL